jgi:hypothetical protein
VLLRMVHYLQGNTAWAPSRTGNVTIRNMAYSKNRVWHSPTGR